VPASDALLLTHLQRIPDRFRDFNFVIWIDDNSSCELLGGTSKLRKD
jgi:hypothetical protein